MVRETGRFVNDQEVLRFVENGKMRHRRRSEQRYHAEQESPHNPLLHSRHCLRKDSQCAAQRRPDKKWDEPWSSSLVIRYRTNRTHRKYDERKRRLVVRSEGQTRKFEYNICAARADPEEDQEDTSVVEGRCRGNARCTRGAEHQSRQPIPMHGVFPLRHRRSLSSPWLLLSIPHTALLP